MRACVSVSDRVSRGFGMCPPRDRQLNSHTQHRETRRSGGPPITSCLVPTMSPRGYSGRLQRNDEDSLGCPSSLSLSPSPLLSVSFSLWHIHTRLFSASQPRETERELGSSVQHPLVSLLVDILTLIGRQRPPCNFIKGVSCPR